MKPNFKIISTALATAGFLTCLVYLICVIIGGSSCSSKLCPDNRATATNPLCYVSNDTAIVRDLERPTYGQLADAGPTEFVGSDGSHRWNLTSWRVVPTATGRVFHCAGGVDMIGPVKASIEDICAQSPGAKP